MLSYSNI